MEKIKLITDSVSNANSLLRRMNENTPIFFYDVDTAVNCAFELIVSDKSKGGFFNGKRIDNSNASYLVLELLKNYPLSFIPEESLCFETAKELLLNMNMLRENYKNEIKDDKVSEILSFIELYENSLRENNLYDDILILKDANEILTKEVDEKKERKVSSLYFNPISSLEFEFVYRYANTLPIEGFSYTKNEKPSLNFVSCHGLVNEADFVARTIADKKLNLDDCEIICDTSLFAPYIYECFSKRGLKCSFDSYTATELDYIQLVKKLIEWHMNGCKYEDLFNIVFNPVFCMNYEGNNFASGLFLKGISYGVGFGSDRYIDVKRCSYDIKNNIDESLEEKHFREAELKELGELSKSIGSSTDPQKILNILYLYLEKHTRNGVYRNYGRSCLYDFITSLDSLKLSFGDNKEALSFILNSLSSLRYSMEDENCSVVVKDIHSVSVPEKDNIFILGLSSKDFETSLDESPILDDEIREKLFISNGKLYGNVSLCKNKNEEGRRILLDTIENSKEKSNIYLSYSSTNILENGAAQNPSNIFSELSSSYDVIHVDSYFDINTWDAEIKNDPIKEEKKNENIEEREGASNLKEMVFSKSRLDDFLSCPFKYHLKYDLYINEEDYRIKNPDIWLSASEFGNLIHSILEYYCTNFIGQELKSAEFDETCKEFIDAIEKAKNHMLSEVKAPSEAIMEKELLEAKEICISYLRYFHKDNYENKWIVCECEADIEKNKYIESFKEGNFTYNIGFSGIIDRIDKKIDENGEEIYRIIDYKTGSKIDLKDTKQHQIYINYLKSLYGKKVSFCYLYLKLLNAGEQKWQCEISDNDEKLVLLDTDKKKFKEYYEDKKYTASKKENSSCCKYCKYNMLCDLNM